MLRKSVTLSLQEKVDFLKSSGKKIYTLSNPSFNPKKIKSLNINKFNLQGQLTGESKLKKLSINYLFKNWNYNKIKNDVIITSGAKAALYCVFKGIGDYLKKANIGIINPNWPTYEDLAKVSGNKHYYFNTTLKNNFEIDCSKLIFFLKKNKIRILLLTSPNNPTGKIITNDKLKKILKICKSQNTYLVIDESFSSYCYIKKKKTKSICIDKNLIIINSFSKNFHLQGLRLGAIMSNKKLSQMFANIHIAVNGSPNYLSQKIIINNKGLLMHSNIKKKMERVSNFLISKGVEFYKPDGSFYIFPKIKNYSNFIKNSNKKGLFFLGGDLFGKAYKKYYRLCFEKKNNELNTILKIMDKNKLY